MDNDSSDILWFEELTSDDVPLVGGKNASLGEMVHHLKEIGVAVPNGFATTSDAFWRFLEENDLNGRIAAEIEKLNDGQASLKEVGQRIRGAVLGGKFSEKAEEAIRNAYRELSAQFDRKAVDVAVRSSATAEDLPDASFAGQQETFLNICGEKALLDACRRCFASLFTDRAISYREQKGFDHLKVALSVGVQKMVRSDRAGAGVAFTIDTESGFPRVVVINASWGLGETVVQGSVSPDEYLVFKPLLEDERFHPIIGKQRGGKSKKMVYAEGGTRATKTVKTTAEERQKLVLDDEEIVTLARWCAAIEDHYQTPMDIEWAKDGDTDEIFIVQARPETVHSQKGVDTIKSYQLREKGEELVRGRSIGDSIVAAPVCRLDSPDHSDDFIDGAILVTTVTHPDWVPVMKRAGGIVTELGGRTSHAAIVSRELGIPAIVGATDAMQILSDGQMVTLSAEGDQGVVYDGELAFDVEEIDVSNLQETSTKIMMNIASPSASFRWWKLPLAGVGLARMEFIIENIIKIHPMALVRFDELESRRTKKEISRLTSGYDDRSHYFVDLLSRGIARIAASQYPHEVVVRMSDFKTNEYADLIGGAPFEPKEDNPMLGFRGASRYYSDLYREGFALECRAIRRAREEMGFDNIVVMIPFCRTIREADKVLEVMAEEGLRRAENGLQVYVMCEVPSNVILADQFADRFDGFSIGSNDLTQLVLGVDRDSTLLSELFDERDEAVKRMIAQVIESAHSKGRKVGICGQAPSDYPEFAAFLVECGIDSISINPDTVAAVTEVVARAEEELRGQ